MLRTWFKRFFQAKQSPLVIRRRRPSYAPLMENLEDRLAPAGIWFPTGGLNAVRADTTATLLNNGEVLVAGGYGNSGFLSSAELYNPATGQWTNTGSLNTARQNATATLLGNGDVLIAGGDNNSGYLSSAELYNPSTGQWTNTGSLNNARNQATATLLNNGDVLVAGGQNGAGDLASAELFDPTTDLWSATGNLTTARDEATATLLNNGEVLIAGGFNNSIGTLSSAELYNPTTDVWTAAGTLNTARQDATAALLNNGNVLVAGGYGTGYLSSAELYNPTTNAWTVTGSLNASREYATATLLNDGDVLIVGGYSSGYYSGGPQSSAELYDPATGVWTYTGSMSTAHQNATATLLNNGEVLVADGYGNNGYSSDAELYDPFTTTDATFIYNTPAPTTVAAWVAAPPTGATYTFTSTNLPSWVTLNPTTGVLSGTPTSVGPQTVTVTASNGTSSDSANFTLNVIEPANLFTTSDATFSYETPGFATVAAWDVLPPANVGYSFTSSDLPSWATLNPGTGVLTGTPNALSSQTVTVTASNGISTATATFMLTVGKATPIVLACDAGGVYNGSPYAATATIAGVVTSGPNQDNTPGQSLQGVPLVVTYYSGATPLSGAPTHAGTYSVVASFAGSTDYLPVTQNAGTFTIGTLASFNSSNNGPFGVTTGLVADGNGDLYGTTSYGGQNGDGTIFEYVQSTNSIITLASFGAGTGPNGNLIIDGSGNLFGTTGYGGQSSDGTIFEYVQGTGQLLTLASFNYSNGATPNGGLVEDSAGDLFGTAQRGGTYGEGTLFEWVQSSGTIQILYNFVYASSNGYYPNSGLAMDANGDLFGATDYGGATGQGILFEWSQSNSSFTVLANFNNANGYDYNGSTNVMTDANGNVFGTTNNGGANGAGTLFEWNHSTSTFSVLGSFNQGNGSSPVGSLLEDASGDLFGVTASSGLSGQGSVFEWVNATGALVTFASLGGNLTGAVGGLVENSSGDLFGAASSGGANNNGAIFEVSPQADFTINQAIATVTVTDAGSTYDGASEPASASVAGVVTSGPNQDNAPGATLEGIAPILTYYAGNAASGAPLAGAPTEAGTYTVVASFPGSADYAPSAASSASFTVNTLTSLGGADLETNPYGSLVADASGDLFGTTSSGGSARDGTIFELSKGSSTVVTLATFDNANGQNPVGLLVGANGNLFGTTQSGGSNGTGTLFEYVVNTGTLVSLASFTGLNGTIPNGALVQDAGGDIFGTTAYGGANGDGTLFEWVKNTSTLVTLVNFTSANVEPVGGLVADTSGNLFGATNNGTLFEWVQSSQSLVTLATLTTGQPNGALLVDANGNLFGATGNAGAYRAGSIFEYVHSTGQIVTLASFNYAGNGANPTGGLIEDQSGNLYGTTNGGGTFQQGTAFEYVPAYGGIVTLAQFNGINGATPSSGLIENGNALFGEASNGGTAGAGTLFSLGVQTTFTIAPASQTITFNPLAPVSGTGNITLGATASSNLAVSYTVVAGPATVTGNTLQVTGAGIVLIQANQAGTNDYLPAATVEQTLLVAPAQGSLAADTIPAITVTPANPVYSAGLTVPLSDAGGGSSSPVVFTVLFGPGFTSGVNGGTLHIIAAGTILLEATQAGDANYAAATPIFQVVTVSQASQSISFPSLTAVAYGQGPIAINGLGASATSGLPIAYAVASGPGFISGNLLYVTGVGTIQLAADQAGNANYSAATEMTQTLQVNKAGLTLTAVNSGKTYGQADPPLTFTYTGLVNGDLAAGFTGALSRDVGESAGAYNINEGSLAATGNYTIATFGTGTFTINTASLTVTAINQSKTYGQANPSFSARYSGFVNSDTAASLTGTLSFGTSATAGSGVGAYAVTPSGVSSSNYSISFLSGTLFVTPAPLTIAADSTLKTYFQPNPTFTASYSGFVNGDNAGSLTGTLSVSTTAAGSSGVGSYPITPSGVASPNYNITFLNGTLFVAKADDAITFGPIPGVPLGGGAVTLNAVGGGSSSPVVYTVLFGPGSVSGNHLTLTGVGTILIEATQAGDANYLAATPVFQAMQVEKAQTITFTQPTTPIAFTTTPITLTGSASSTLPVAFSVVSGPGTVSGNKLTVTGVGSIVIEADQAGNATYAPAAPIQRTIVVTKANQTITFNALTAVSFGVSPITLGATASSGLPISYSVMSGPSSISGNQLTITGVGSVVIQATQGGNANFNAATSVSRTLVVNKASQTISFAVLDPITFGLGSVTLSAAASSGLPISYAVVSGPGSVNGNQLTITGAGAIVIKAMQAGNGNYAAAVAITRTLTVNKATLIVAANNALWTAGVAGQHLAGFTITGFVNGDTQTSLFAAEAAAVSCSTVNANNPVANSYVILIVKGTLVTPANYTLTFQTGTLTVS